MRTIGRRMFLLVAAILTTLTVSAGVANGQSSDSNLMMYHPELMSIVPGCGPYPDPNIPGAYQEWCGSDEQGWYTPFQWYQMTGIWPTDYGVGGGG